MSENIIPPTPIDPAPERGDSSVPQGSDLEGSAQPTDTTVGRSDPQVAPIAAPPKKFPTFFLFLLPILLIVAVISIYVLLQARTMYQQSIIIPSPSLPPTSSPLASESLDTTLEPSPFLNTDPNIKTFISDKLGITFQYQEKSKGSNEIITTKEIGNKVYVYSSSMKPEQGQYAEVFDKDKQDDLVTSIKKSVMQGYSPDDCPIHLTGKNLWSTMDQFPSTYVPAQIGLPDAATQSGMENAQSYLDKCPAKYVAFGGLSYFLADSVHPSKFAFFSIGQYAIKAGGNKVWQDTFKFTDQNSITYSCPASSYVNCMPGPDSSKQKTCSPEAMAWYKTNCPGFQGAAL